MKEIRRGFRGTIGSSGEARQHLGLVFVVIQRKSKLGGDSQNGFLVYRFDVSWEVVVRVSFR